MLLRCECPRTGVTRRAHDVAADRGGGGLHRPASCCWQGAGRIESDRRHDEMDPTLRKMNASQGADVTVQLSSPVGNSAHNIEVHHAGPAAAEIITVTSLDADNGRPCPIMRAWLELSRPPRAGVSKDVVAGLPPQSNRRLHVAVVWRDGNGSHRAESVLQV